MRHPHCCSGSFRARGPVAVRSSIESAPQHTPSNELSVGPLSPGAQGTTPERAGDFHGHNFRNSSSEILVIDGNHGEVQELRAALTDCGEPYELSVLQDGDAALRFVEDQRSGLRQPEPCAIVLDLNLPKHDALAVLAAIGAEPALSHIRVLVVGTVAVRETQALLREMGGLYREMPRDLPRWLDMAVQLLALCQNERLPGNIRHKTVTARKKRCVTNAHRRALGRPSNSRTGTL